jgi:hypothetical protein
MPCSFCRTHGHNVRTCPCAHSQEGDCAVCLETMSEIRAARVATCKHVFHADCLEQWTQHNPTCPLCRQVAQPLSRPKHAVIEVTEGGVLYHWCRNSGPSPKTSWGIPLQPNSISTGRTHWVLHRGDTWYAYAYALLAKNPSWTCDVDDVVDVDAAIAVSDLAEEVYTASITSLDANNDDLEYPTLANWLHPAVVLRHAQTPSTSE